MAINVSFNGATIYKPGAYSKINIDLGGAFPLGPTGLIGILGESTRGTPGSLEVDISQNFFTASQVPEIIEKYGSGNIVDACNFLFAPASDGAIPSGAQAVYIYKTNASTRAALNLANSYGTLTALVYGEQGNRIVYSCDHVAEVAPEVIGTSPIVFTAVPAVAQIEQITCASGAIHTQADHFIIKNQAGLDYSVWLDIDANGTAPTGAAHLAASSAIQVSILSTDTAIEVAAKIFAAVNSSITGVSVTDPAGGVDIIFTQDNAGACADASVHNADETAAGAFIVVLNVDGADLDPGDGTPYNNLTFGIYISGSAQQVITLSGLESDHDSQAKLLAEINGQLTGAVASFNTNDFLVLTVDSDLTAHQNGYGKSLELAELNVGDLAVLGLVKGISFSSVESAANLMLEQRQLLLAEEDVIGGNVVLTGGYTGSATSATVTIDHENDLFRLSEDAVNSDYKISTYSTLIELVNDLNVKADWSFALSSSLYNQMSASSLDPVSAVSAHTIDNKPLRIKKDYSEFVDFTIESSIISHDEVSLSPTLIGLPEVQAETFLNSVVGSTGATSGADITNGLLEFEGIRLNAIVPLFSRDATDDIADGLTDVNSSYSIAAIHQGVKSHLSKTATTKSRSERQGYLSFKGFYSTTSTGYTSGDSSLDVSNDLAFGRVQLTIQDTKNVDSQGNIKWYQPWALACNLAGARGGSPIGTPLTNKYMNVAGIRHTSQPMRTAEEDIVVDFNPRTQFEQAIQQGLTFLENPQSGGFKVVVDNTTYGKDGNWVWNRGNIIYAADVLAYDFRDQMEKIYVGTKNTASAAEVRSTAESILANYLAQGITVTSDDAPNGFKSLVVSIVGTTINISVIVKLVEGIDFVLADITLSRKVSEA